MKKSIQEFNTKISIQELEERLEMTVSAPTEVGKDDDEPCFDIGRCGENSC